LVVDFVESVVLLMAVVDVVEVVVTFGFATPFSSSKPLTYLTKAAFYSLTDFNKSFFVVTGLGFTSIFYSSLEFLALFAPGVARGYTSKVYLVFD